MKSKRKKKVKSPGSGRHIPQEIYDALFQSYFKHESLDRAAKDAGVSLDTARRYINDGSDRYPAIAERVLTIRTRAIEEQDEDLIMNRRFFHDTVMSIAKKAADSLQSVVVQPTGNYVLDDNGEPVRDKNGNLVIAIDEGTLCKMVDVFKSMTELVDAITHVQKEPTPAAAVQVNSTFVLTHEAVAASAQGVLKNAGVVPGITLGTEEEQRVREVLVQEAVKRTKKSDNIVEADFNVVGEEDA